MYPPLRQDLANGVAVIFVITVYASVRSLAGVKIEPLGNFGYCDVLRLNALLLMALNATIPAIPTGIPKRKLLREIRLCSLLSML